MACGEPQWWYDQFGKDKFKDVVFGNHPPESALWNDNKVSPMPPLLTSAAAGGSDMFFVADGQGVTSMSVSALTDPVHELEERVAALEKQIALLTGMESPDRVVEYEHIEFTINTEAFLGTDITEEKLCEDAYDRAMRGL